MAGSEAGGGGGVNWSAAATVDLFDNMQQRRARWRLLLVSSSLVLLLGVPLWVLRGQLQDAARQTLQGEYDREQARLQGLTSLNPAVRERADRAGALRAGAGAKSADLAIPDLREALDLIDQAEQLARAERGLRELLNPLGETLAGTQWYVSSDWIRNQLAALSEKHQATVTLLDQGEVAKAEADAAELLRSLGELQAANVQAMQADVIRRDWQRMLGRVPERLRGDAVYQSLVSRGEQGEGWWKEGKWKDAGLSFGGATAQLQQWLDGDGGLTAEEKAATAALSEGEIARLESEQQVLKNEKAELEVQLKALTAQVSVLGAERDQARAESGQRQSELSQLQSSLQATEQKLAAAEAGLRDVREKELKPVQLQADSLKTQLAAKDAEIEVLKNRPGGAAGGDPASLAAAALARIAAEQVQLQQQNGDREQVLLRQTGLLVDALQQYDAAEQRKRQALAEKYLETSDRVRGITAEMMQCEQLLAGLLRDLDKPLAEKYQELQASIDGAKKDYAQLLTQVSDEHVDAKTLAGKIAELEQQQRQYQPARQRFAGQQTLSGAGLLQVCRVYAAAEQSRRRSEYSKQLIAEGKRRPLPETLVAIKGGSFMMGSNAGDSDEKPVHRVTVKDFWISQHEETTEEVLVWLNAPGVVVQDGWIDFDSEYCPIRRNGSKYELNTASKFGQSGQQPMVCITQRGAMAYCQWKQTLYPGWTIRLPYEAEWEYAARAGSTTEYPWGDSITTADANISGGPGVTTEVGSYRPNAWGLYDTVGNCWEWCLDSYDADYYSSSPAENPRGPLAAGGSVVCRSGSWHYDAADARSAYRGGINPDGANLNIGFRIVAE
jgi:formylglycine-generating enzyme required for sulfatase activity